MWYSLGKAIVKNRILLLIILFVVTAFMGYKASKVQMGYDFTRAIPIDNVKYIDYQKFLKKFGGDGNTLVIGIKTDSFFTVDFFNAVGKLHQNLKKTQDVQDVLSIPEAVTLVKDSALQQFVPQKIFHYPYASQTILDSDKYVFQSLPFYKGILYNPATNAYLIGVTVNKDTINSKSRTRLINSILKEVTAFETSTKIQTHISGLPYIRTTVANRIKNELNLFLIGSFLLSAITLFIFFRSFSATIMSLFVVGIGVVWCLGTMVLFNYKITILTALIPILIVVIGIPNCIYFLNKYHTSFKEVNNKEKAIVNMIGKMGIVTLFCNIAAAIGFIVFAFTHSNLLKEFGLVSGINIMALFFISLIFIPAVLYYLPAPKTKHIKYLENKTLNKILIKIEKWVFQNSKWVWAVTIAVTVFAITGIFKLKSEGFIVDDLPKQDKTYTDLKWFETNFKGIMPLEIMVEAKKKGALKRSTAPMQKIDELSTYLSTKAETAKPLSLVEALKFAKQAYFDGDSSNYAVPTDLDMAMMSSYLKNKNKKPSEKTALARLMNSFIDSTYQTARISVNMKDIGSKQLPVFLNDVEQKAREIFDTANYKVTFTGSSVTFLEGSSFIINGLKESILWAFSLIALCMLFLFRSVKILLCSLIPNIIPLIITAGIMGWCGISLKPSTVLVFSVTLGIVIDVTIRFLVNYKQETDANKHTVQFNLSQTIKHTGISIIYTSLVLIAGFAIFCFSSFGGTFALGWLTSLTLVVGTITNLLLLPVLINFVSTKKDKSPLF
ncbi:MAG: MMPL family transporter [Bacteroidetes bacterium]|nr:MMPL family transporter [Bacteroidota bacterium]MBS1639453.1 MMPL family transporter [Bacteroidota bacterium]